MRYQMTPVDCIRDESNVRKAPCPQADAELTESIRQEGVKQPIIVIDNQDGTYTLVCGARRLRCGKAAGLAEIPTIILPVRLAADELELVQLTENVQRCDLNHADLAESVTHLVDVAGWPANRVATRLGKSEPTISRLYTIGRGPKEILDQLRAGAITLSAAYSLCRPPCRTDAVTARKLHPAAIRPKRAAAWKMYRTIGLGVGMTVSGSDMSYDRLLGVVTRFLEQGRKAAAASVPVTQFLSDFHRDDGIAAEGVAA